MSNKKIIISAVIFGLLTALAVNYYLIQAKAALNNVQTFPVLVAKAAIPAKTELKGDMLEVRKIPKQYIHTEALVSLKDIANKITAVDIAAGEQVLVSRLVSTKETGNGLSYTIPKGYRAIAVGVNSVTGVASLIQTGDLVDVVGLMEIEQPNPDAAAGNSSAKVNLPIAKVVLQNIKVLAIDQKLDRVKPSTDKKKDGTPTETKTVTLAVKPEDIEKVALINERGVVTLALRSPVDQGKYVPKTYSPKDYLVR